MSSSLLTFLIIAGIASFAFANLLVFAHNKDKNYLAATLGLGAIGLLVYSVVVIAIFSTDKSDTRKAQCRAKVAPELVTKVDYSAAEFKDVISTICK